MKSTLKSKTIASLFAAACCMALQAGIVYAEGPSAPVTYDLKEYLALVEKNNLTLLISDKDRESASAGRRAAFSQFLPSVAAQGGYTRNLKDVMQSTAVAASSTQVSGIYPLIYKDVDSNYDNQISMALSATWKVIDPSVLAQYEKAKKGAQIQDEVTEYTRQQVLAGAKKLYAQTQLLVSVSSVKKEAAAVSEAVCHDVEKKYNAGTATEVNLRMAEVDWKNDAAAQSAAENNVRISMIALKNLAGLPLDADISLPAGDETVPPIPEAAELGSILGARLDYQAAFGSKDIASITSKAAVASFLPTVNASFTCAYAQLGGYEGKDDWDAYNTTQSSLGITVTIPLFTGGARIAALQSAKIQKESVDLQLREKRNAIEQETEQLRMALEEDLRQIDSARTLAAATGQALVITRTAYENGMDTQLELSKALSQDAGAQVNLQNAIFQYKAALYDYQTACGMTDD